MRKYLFLIPFFALSTVRAAIHTEAVTYSHGNAALVGYLAYDDASQEKRPGILVTHEWWGLTDHIKQMTEELAKLGYVAFAPDIYGKGQITTDPSEAGKWSSIYKSDRGLMRGRMDAGLSVLKKQKMVDTGRIAAIGFCFGGTCSLELARAGANVNGVVSFHGGLDTPNPDDAKNIKGKVLVLTGGDDNYIPPEQIIAFEKEMRDAKVDWQLNSYGNAVHGYTNPTAGTDNSKGYAYNEKAAKRSWLAMQDFFREIFVK